MFLGEGRLVLFDFGLAKLWQARHIYMCVLEMYIYTRSSMAAGFLSYVRTHLLTYYYYILCVGGT